MQSEHTGAAPHVGHSCHSCPFIQFSPVGATRKGHPHGCGAGDRSTSSYDTNASTPVREARLRLNLSRALFLDSRHRLAQPEVFSQPRRSIGPSRDSAALEHPFVLLDLLAHRARVSTPIDVSHSHEHRKGVPTPRQGGGNARMARPPPPSPSARRAMHRSTRRCRRGRPETSP
jgi:hypothetical protein